MTLHEHDDATAIEHGNALELKLVDSGTAGEFSGYAATFNGVDSHRDTIRPGAFAASIAAHKAEGRMPPLLMAHDQARVVGKIISLAEDSVGLTVTGKFNLATSAGRDAHAHAKANDINGLSIGYTVPPGGSSHARDGTRTLQRIDVAEISLVALGSDKAARIRQVKMLAGPGELEDLLREAGLSRRAAQAVTARGFAGLTKSVTPEIDHERVAGVLRQQALELKRWK